MKSCSQCLRSMVHSLSGGQSSRIVLRRCLACERSAERKRGQNRNLNKNNEVQRECLPTKKNVAIKNNAPTRYGHFPSPSLSHPLFLCLPGFPHRTSQKTEPYVERWQKLQTCQRKTLESCCVHAFKSVLDLIRFKG